MLTPKIEGMLDVFTSIMDEKKNLEQIKSRIESLWRYESDEKLVESYEIQMKYLSAKIEGLDEAADIALKVARNEVQA